VFSPHRSRPPYFALGRRAVDSALAPGSASACEGAGGAAEGRVRLTGPRSFAPEQMVLT
jgi:hypothetical protein